MREETSRSALIIGNDALHRLEEARVAVFGIGGVGGTAAEALVRGGIGELDIIDDDAVSLSNINRQIFALHSNVGAYKVDAAKSRLLDINPDLKLTTHKVFFSPETSHFFDFSVYDYVIDAIDSVTGKIELAVKAEASATPIISAMGAGNKLDPTAFEVTDIYKTSVCPLARVMRHELRRRGIKKLKVVYSKEEPISNLRAECDG
ncbi:MAG: tRNA threonylcarbamoyladenosine dehydratase, partial [Firmicutes bacterium]|nr:tRNA threonylcarbamoyladenosine dehydratase [Bacillota bacterium]